MTVGADMTVAGRVIAFDDLDEAIHLANATEYGLAAHLCSGNMERALRTAERLDFGMVGLNRAIVSNAAAPFGGIKRSGLGRVGGREGTMTTSISRSPSTPSLSRAPGTVERIVLTVPEPEATAEFLGDGFAMEILENKDGRLLAVCEGEYGSGRGQGAIELTAGDRFSVERLVLALPDDADLAHLEKLLDARRVSDTSVAITDPATDITVALELTTSLNLAVPTASALRPRRMGHVNLKTPRPTDTASFFTEVLGLRLSEYIGEALFWMRTDTEHHNVALRPGAARAVHHVGLEVAGWHAYQPILDHLDSRGFKVEYGPGRHRPGRSLFTYVCDPSSGLRIELFADMVHIPDPTTPPIGWEPGDRLTTTLNTWGPLPPESFLE